LAPEYSFALDKPIEDDFKYKAVKLNLKDNSTEEFTDPGFNTYNYYQYLHDDSHGSMTNGNPYYVVADKDPEFTSNNIGGFDSHYKNRRSLFVRSYYNPKENIVEMKLDEPSNITFDWQVLWSLDGNYLAVVTHDNESYKKDPKLYIFSRQGKLISKSELLTEFFFAWGTFSSDDKYLLLNSLKSTTISLADWKIIDIQTGKIVVDYPAVPAVAVFWKI